MLNMNVLLTLQPEISLVANVNVNAELKEKRELYVCIYCYSFSTVAHIIERVSRKYSNRVGCKIR